MRTCSLSVDLDPIACYYGIHGMGTPSGPLVDVVLRRALPRFADLFTRHGISATFFVVGADLVRDRSGRALLRELSQAGHELANHSHTHPYELARLSKERIDDEVMRAHEAIAEAGEPPVGFRSPGYDLSARMLDVLMARGYRYDSSILPSWSYYFAKAAVMTAMAAMGRRSHSVLGDPRALLVSAQPYRPGRSPFRRGQATLVELPVAVSPILRLPAIGTSLLLAPALLRSHLVQSMRRRSFFNFELHGIDLIGAEEDGIPSALVARQPDLRVPLSHKLRVLDETIAQLVRDYRFVPLRDAASEVQREGLIRAN